MTTIPAPSTFRLPTTQELKVMLHRTSVFITVVLCVTFLVSLAIGGVLFLAYHGRPTEAITGLLGGSLLSLMVGISTQLRRISQRLDSGDAKDGTR